VGGVARVGKESLYFSIKSLKLIQLLGKLVYTDRWKIRMNMPSSLVFFTSRD